MPRLPVMSTAPCALRIDVLALKPVESEMSWWKWISSPMPPPLSGSTRSTGSAPISFRLRRNPGSVVPSMLTSNPAAPVSSTSLHSPFVTLRSKRTVGVCSLKTTEIVTFRPSLLTVMRMPSPPQSIQQGVNCDALS